MSGWAHGATAQQFAAASRARRVEVAAALEELRHQHQAHQASRADVEARRQVALGELVAALVPSLHYQALARAGYLTGYAPLGQPNPLEPMKNERQRLERRIAEIEAERRFQDRELLRAPRVGTLTRQIDELRQYRAPLADVLDRCAHLRLDRLIEVHYGTPDYDVGFWRASYYADWKAGDEILERFPDKQTFAEVRADYLQAREAVSVYDAKLGELLDEVAAGERLEAEHTQCRRLLATLEERFLAAIRGGLTRHLSEIDLNALGPRLASAPELEVMAKRVAGLASKLVYLDRLAEHQLVAPVAELQRTLDKLDRDIAKYTRPKHWNTTIPAPIYQRRSESLLPRIEKRQARFHKTYQRVYLFDDYDDGRLAVDFLWWDLMTDGRVDGDFIPEVHAFHQRFPAYQYQRPSDDDDRDDDVAAAAAVAAWDASGGADSSVHLDAS